MPTTAAVRARARRSLAYAGVPVAVLAATSTAGAQVVAIDEGTFAVSHGGAAVGREEFRIVRQPAGGGSAYVARAVGAYGSRRVTPALQTDGDGEPVRYQTEVRGGGPEERVTAQGGVGGHFVAQVQRDGREGAREYLLAPGTVVVDDESYSQLYFVARRALAGATTIPVFVPRTDAQLMVTVTRAGSGPITIGGRAMPATRFSLADARTGWRREMWVDAEGRVLRVTAPALGLDAVREDPPH